MNGSKIAGDPSLKEIIKKRTDEFRASQNAGAPSEWQGTAAQANKKPSLLDCRPPPASPITLILSRDQAQALHDVLYRVAGDPSSSRKHITPIFRALDRAGFAHTSGVAKGLITFVDDDGSTSKVPPDRMKDLAHMVYGEEQADLRTGAEKARYRYSGARDL